jgi:hypothetical protein
VNRLRAACRHVLDAWCRLPATFPEVNSPKPGDEIVAFLIYNRDEQVYSFTAASWSVFRVVDERIVSLTAECALTVRICRLTRGPCWTTYNSQSGSAADRSRTDPITAVRKIKPLGIA